MRYITVPPTVALTNLMGDAMTDENGVAAMVSFKEFVTSRLTDVAFAREGMDSALAVAAICEQVITAEAGAVVAFEDEHWRLLCEVTKRPTSQPGGLLDPYYAPIILHNMVTFMKAICDAPDKQA